MLNISVMASGGGTNFQAIIDAIESREIRNAKIKLLIASNDKAGALARAKKAGIETKVISAADIHDKDKLAETIIAALDEADTDLVVLAGYMSILDAPIIREYDKKIINIHPSLIPKFCGRGMYGIKVHEAVLAAGETVTGGNALVIEGEQRQDLTEGLRTLV